MNQNVEMFQNMHVARLTVKKKSLGNKMRLKNNSSIAATSEEAKKRQWKRQGKLQIDTQWKKCRTWFREIEESVFPEKVPYVTANKLFAMIGRGDFAIASHTLPVQCNRPDCTSDLFWPYFQLKLGQITIDQTAHKTYFLHFQ